MPERHRSELVESIAGEPLVNYRRAPRTFRRDRICAAPECSTHLSIYNPGAYCSAHGPFGVWSLPNVKPVLEGNPSAAHELSDQRLVS